MKEKSNFAMNTFYDFEVIIVIYICNWQISHITIWFYFLFLNSKHNIIDNWN